MRGTRAFLIGPTLAACLLASTSVNSSDWRDPTGVCVDSRGCGSNSSRGSDAFSSGPPSIAWGKMTKRAVNGIEACGSSPGCVLLRTVTWLPMGLMFDAPVFVFKGVVYGGYYGAKGFYYGARGLGKGVAYTGRAIGRGLAYPFNRPPKPILPPTTWEQYKHDVLKHQKALAKANKANKDNQRWCVKNVPLEISPNRAKWEGLCNAGDAVSRAALPPNLVAAALAPVPVESVAAAAIPTTEPTTVAALPPTAAPTATAEKAPEASSDRQTSSLPEKTDAAAAAEPLTPVPTSVQPTSSDASATPQAPVAAQQAIQTGVAPDKSGLVTAAAGTAPASPAQGAALRTLPSATPANTLTPSEYSFEGRGGYGVRYDHIWGKASSADLFIEKWNILQPLSSLQAAIQNTLYDKGTAHAKTTLWDKAKEIASDLLTRVHGSAAIVDRAANTVDGIIKVKSYPMDLIDHDLALINAATTENIEQVDAASNAQLAEGYKDLKHTTVETVMGQAGDPIEKVKDYTLEKTNEVLPMAAPKNKPLQETAIHHWVEGLGLGDSKAKVIH